MSHMAHNTQKHVTDNLTTMREHEAAYVEFRLAAMEKEIARIRAELRNVTPGHTPVAEYANDLLRMAGGVATSCSVIHGYDMGLLFASK